MSVQYLRATCITSVTNRIFYLFVCDTELSQSRDNIVVKSHTRALPEFGILQQYYSENEIISYMVCESRIREYMWSVI